MIDFDDDINEMMSEDDHALPCVYNGHPFSAILNNEFFEVEGQSVGFESSQPVLYPKSSDVQGVSQGDNVQVNGTAYKIVGVQPDGTGLTALVLNNA